MATAQRILSGFIIAGILQGIFQGIVLLRASIGARTANRILAILLLFFSANIAVQELLFPGADIPIDRYFLGIGAFQFILGPALFFYAKALTDRSFRHGRRDLGHFLPSILYACVSLGFFILHPVAGQRMPAWLSTALVLTGRYLWIVFLLHTGAYLLLIFRMLHGYSARLRTERSSIGDAGLSWLRSIGIAFVASYSLLTFFFLALSHGRPLVPIGETASLTLCVLVYTLGYFGMLKRPAAPVMEGAAGPASPKYARSGMGAAELSNSIASLKRLMEEEKPYLDPDLGLSGLAAEAGLTPTVLSRVINEGSGMNFYDFVNMYRVEEAKRIFLDPDHAQRSILDIAFGSGFNSKSTFNAFFRKATGVTPKAYRKKSPRA